MGAILLVFQTTVLHSLHFPKGIANTCETIADTLEILSAL